MSKGEADAGIAFKFIQNPAQINSVDDMYELLDLGKNQPVKYFIVERTDKNIFSKAKNSFLYKSRLSTIYDDKTGMSM